jgi:fatty acid desaturase
MLPEAWNVEHNNLHHYRLGEVTDPDLVEENLKPVREAPIPVVARYAFVAVLASIWKWYYYAPNTYKELAVTEERKRLGRDPVPKEGYLVTEDLTLTKLIFERPFYWVKPMDYFRRVVGPYFLFYFVALPLPALLLGRWYFWNAVANLVVAEALTNLHSFLTIATNHTGSDLYRFDTSCKPRSAAYYLRQVVSSANYTAGDDITDFLHGFLNYQIEHHLWPDLSMLSYQKAMPLVKDICRRHGVPYIQQSVWHRLRLTLQIMVGTANMRRWPACFAQSGCE